MHERLQADNVDVALVAQRADQVSGGHVVGRRGAAGEVLGYIEKVFVEEFDVQAVSGGCVELGGEVVDPGSAERVRADCWTTGGRHLDLLRGGVRIRKVGFVA